MISERFQAIESILDDRIVGMEFINFFCGKYIGYGESRYVFRYELDYDLVIKIDCSSWNANVEEYKVWEAVRNTKMAKWFAPVERISDCGRILLMKYCKPATNLPKRIPMFFDDIKSANWGIYKGKPVCLDYSINHVTQFGLEVSSLKTVNWKK